MFNHIMLGASDLEASRAFYDAMLGALGVPPGRANKNRYFYSSEGNIFAISTPIDGETASSGNGSTTGFKAKSEAEANAAYAAALANGGVSVEDPPGYRGEGAARLYLAYVRDPAGNKICLAFRPAKEA